MRMQTGVLGQCGAVMSLLKFDSLSVTMKAMHRDKERKYTCARDDDVHDFTIYKPLCFRVHGHFFARSFLSSGHRFIRSVTIVGYRDVSTRLRDRFCWR